MPMSSQAARAKRQAQILSRSTRKPNFDEGYLRIPGAAVWQGTPAPSGTPARRKSRWAKTPWKTPLGMCLAIGHQEDGEFVVCVERAGVRVWRPWKEVEEFVGVKLWVQRYFD